MDHNAKTIEAEAGVPQGYSPMDPKASRIDRGRPMVLKRVPPGQRNGAQRWLSSRTNVHVDDKLIANEAAEDSVWLIEEQKQMYKLQVEEPYPK